MRKPVIVYIVLIALAAVNSCKTEKSDIVSDIDGNKYNVITIGNQRWLQQNLQTTHYNNGSTITEMEDSATWYNTFNPNSETPVWCYYNENPANNGTYGKLYNWYVVTDPRGVCPVGFHVPTDSDFIILSNYYQGDMVAGGCLKSESGLWASPNTDALNSSDFSGLPGGYRGNYGGYHDVSDYGFFWSATQQDSSYAWLRFLGYGGGNFTNDTMIKDYAFSIRCVGN